MAEKRFYIVWDTELDEQWIKGHRAVWTGPGFAKNAWNSARVGYFRKSMATFSEQTRFVVKEVRLVPIDG